MNKTHFNSDDVNKVFKSKLIDKNYSGASLDSRLTKKNNIFFAINGKKNNGHNFIKNAYKNGTSLAIVERLQKNIGIPQIKVDDTHKALIRFAKYYRKNLNAKILAITGSVGKTSSKDALAKILSSNYKIFFSRESYNNHFGVPLEILNMPLNSEIGIFELGMNHKKEISKLTKILNPETVCILNVNFVHGGNFKSVKDIAMAKAEITNSSKDLKTVIINYDSTFYNLIKKTANKDYKKSIISFGLNKGADIFLFKKKTSNSLINLSVLTNDNKKICYKILLNHEYLIPNTLALIACLKALNVNLSYIKKYNENLLPQGRGNLIKLKYSNMNFKLVDHSYNASPTSFISTMDAFNNYKSKKKIFILGEMFELGEKKEFYHKKIINHLDTLDGQFFFLIGAQYKKIMNKCKKNNYIFLKSVDELLKCFKKYISNGSIVYIK